MIGIGINLWFASIFGGGGGGASGDYIIDESGQTIVDESGQGFEH